MSIFNKPTDQITTPDLQELLANKAIENVRLEFKLQDTAKDEALKKLTSFANTYGGYLVVGAQEDGSGRLIGLPGVQAISGFRQRLIQWGYDSVSPPLLLFASDPVTSPQDANRVCYVVHVPESEETPHFINDRKGCYIRTDEFSQRFEPQLATYEEIQHLANRRAVVVERRESLVKRATDRFGTYVMTSGLSGSTLRLSICPSFPSKPLVSHSRLLQVLGSVRVQWRVLGFPKLSTPISQHESGIIVQADHEKYLLEANIWGLLFYAYDILQRPRREQDVAGIHEYGLLGSILVALEHARVFYEQLGFEGHLLVRTRLEGIRNVQLLMTGGSVPGIDNIVEFDLTTTSDALKTNRDGLALEVLQTIMFALDRARIAADPNELKELLMYGYKYNSWRAR